MQVARLFGTVKVITKFGSRQLQENISRTAPQATRSNRHIKIHQKIGRAL